MKLLTRVLIVALAVLGLVVLLTDWIEWPWWVALGLCAPFALLLLAIIGGSYGGSGYYNFGGGGDRDGGGREGNGG